jgi:hypothetical protein
MTKLLLAYRDLMQHGLDAPNVLLLGIVFVLDVVVVGVIVLDVARMYLEDRKIARAMHMTENQP